MSITYHPTIPDGIKNKAEKAHCIKLISLRNEGIIKHIRYEKRYSLEVNNVVVTTHRPDFTVTYSDGHEEVHEIKTGNFTNMDGSRVRRSLFMALFPNIKYRIFTPKGEAVMHRTEKGAIKIFYKIDSGD